ncbi:MAG: ATP-binding cassette domain-containing protein [Chloroflexi bacterium]|nr:ATP-binding cassette domain-containing protein [Chloroflexota bacterium]
MALLQTRGLTKVFGSFRAVDNVDLDVDEGGIHALVGPNGAGKTTILNLLGGQLLPSAGQIVLDGKSIEALRPDARAHAGIGRSFQLTSIVPGFTCRQNVVIAVQAKRPMAGLLRLRAHAADASFADELLNMVGLVHAAETPADLLAHGQQRQLEVAMALGGRPRVLLLDEPSSGTSVHERQLLGQLLKGIAAHTTVVMAEHDVPLVRAVATRVSAFSNGHTLVEGDADEVFESAEVQRVFLRGVRDV